MAERIETRARFGQGRDRTELVGFLLATALLMLGEVLILFRFGDIGLVAHALAIVVTLVYIQRTTEPASLLFQSLLLVPILRIFNLGLPLFTDDPLVFLSVIYLMLLLSTAMIVRSQALSLADLGLTLDDARLLIPGLLIGLVLGLVQHLLALEGLAYEETIRNYVLIVLTTGFLVGLVEELIFRGLIQRWVDRVFGKWVAIVSVSVLFGFMHSVWLAPLDIVFAGTVSLFLGWVYAETNNLWFITGVHAAINIGAFLLAPLYFDQMVDMLVSLG